MSKYHHLTIISIVLLCLVEIFGIFEAINLRCYDLFFRLRGWRPADNNIVIVAIDEKTLDQAGRWPIDRRLYSDLLDKTQGAKAVAFDIILHEPTKSDALLATSFEKHKKGISCSGAILPAAHKKEMPKTHNSSAKKRGVVRQVRFG